MSRALARVAQRLGVQIDLGTPVSRLLFSGKRAIGVETEEGNLFADAVVVNADFARAMQRLVPNALRRKWTDRRIEKKKWG